MKKFALFITALLVFGCATSAKVSIEDLTKDESKLSQTEAIYRESLLSNVEYNLTFKFDAVSTSYTGSNDIKIQWRGKKTDNLWLDFNQGTLTELKVNEKAVDFQQKKHRILIPGVAFSPGTNRITVQFKQNYSTDGSGIYRFHDPEDKAVYLYTTLEPFDANRVFPCFDQPDLKASFAMKITAPASWTVVGYDKESTVEKLSENSAAFKVWDFPKSLVFSTYVWSIHAGPFRVWNDDQARIPSRLLARKSLARYVNPEEWFTVTRQGFDFFEKYFDEPYAFKKYDQIVVPDFKAGAMENVGAVSFSERTISRGTELNSEKRDRADVILHEMAHMWFGNLVTMKWWNDLWLNESFATYMAALASSKATEFSGDETWREFYNTKTWAYSTDLQVTTHPIEATIKTTDDAFLNFDGITYGKGASLMKQLDFYLGVGGFQKGIQIYFNRHRYSNSTLADFIAALEEGSQKNLARWTKEWLRSKGLNTVAFLPECLNGKLANIHFEQKVFNGDPVFRSQKTRLGLFVKTATGLALDSTVDVEYSGKSGNHALIESKPCPALIYSNIDDQAYFLPEYTDQDLKTIVENYSQLENPFLRQTLIFDLWQSTRRGETKLSDFADILYKAIGIESDPAGVEALFIYLKSRWGGASLYRYTDFNNGEGLEAFEDLIWELYRKSPAKSELRKIYEKFYLSFARSPNHLNNLRDLLNPEFSKKMGATLDQDRRWTILKQLAENNEPTIADRLALESRRDGSHFGQQAELAARARQPDKVQKRLLFDQIIHSDPPRTSEQVGIIAKNLLPHSQASLAAEFQNDFFVNLKVVKDTFEPERLGAYLDLLPEECFYGIRGKINEFLKTNQQLPPMIIKEFKITNQEQEICRLIRQRDKKKKL